MDKRKPKNIDEYKLWLKNEHKIDIDRKIKEHYISVTLRIKQEFEKSKIWNDIINKLSEYSDEYYIKTGYPLLMPNFKPEILIKSFNPFLLKTFRKNVILNENWPKPPQGGWFLPNNWFSRINDIIRTLIVVKYLDGVEFIIEKIRRIADKNKKKCNYFFESTEDGYYAAHFYLNEKFEIPRIDWDTEIIDINIEIQITTQLQEVIRQLLHKYYEQKRLLVVSSGDEIPWQWNYEKEEFLANYLGHILHYIEGMIMKIRKKQSEGDRK